MAKLKKTSKRSSQSFQNVFENFVKNDVNKSDDNLLTKILKTKKSDETSKKSVKNVVNNQSNDISKEDNIYLKFVQKSDEKMPEKKRRGRKPKTESVSQPLVSKNLEKRAKSTRICAKTVTTEEPESKSALKTNKSPKSETNDSKVKKPNRRKSCLKLDFKTIDVTKDNDNIDCIKAIESVPTVCDVITAQKVDEKVPEVEKVAENVEQIVNKVEEVIQNETIKNSNESNSQEISCEIKSSQKSKNLPKNKKSKSVEKSDGIQTNTESIRRSTRVRKATELYTSEVNNKSSKQKTIKDNQTSGVDESDVESKGSDKTVKKVSKTNPKSKAKNIQKSTKSKKTDGRKGIGKLLNDFRNRNKGPDYLKRLKYVEKDPTIDILHKKLGLVSTRLSAIPESNEDIQ